MRLTHLCSFALLIGATPLSAQQRTVAERLGHPRDAKLLIIHGDDLGVSHSVDSASFAALDRGAITSVSAMIPTPWISEVTAYAKAHPQADIGLHLTLTSEWKTYRWGSVASSDQVRTLLDSDGTFYRDVEPVAMKARPEEVERELRAQVERALALGIRPTHLDSHMGALYFSTPELLAAGEKVAREYRVPFLAVRNFGRGPSVVVGLDDVAFDAVIIATEEVQRERWKQWYVDVIRNLKPGLTELIVHLGFNDAELRAVMGDQNPWAAAWRQRDYDVVNSPEFRKALADNKVILVTWHDLQSLQPRP